MGTFSIWHWIIVLVIVVLVFGTKKLRNLGGDLGSAIKGFKEGMKESQADHSQPHASVDEHIIDAQAKIENPPSSLGTNHTSPSSDTHRHTSEAAETKEKTPPKP